MKSALSKLSRIGGLIPLQPLRGIYFLVDDEAVVYVGQSKNVYTRVAQHTDKVFTDVFVLPVATGNLGSIEKKFIKRFKPKYNYAHTLGIRWDCRMSVQALELLDKLSIKLKITRDKVLEIAVRQMAKAERVK